jgi:hypothetical protein
VRTHHCTDIEAAGLASWPSWRGQGRPHCGRCRCGRSNNRMGRPRPLPPPIDGNRRKTASSCGPSNGVRPASQLGTKVRPLRRGGPRAASVVYPRARRSFPARPLFCGAHGERQATPPTYCGAGFQPAVVAGGGQHRNGARVRAPVPRDGNDRRRRAGSPPAVSRCLRRTAGTTNNISWRGLPARGRSWGAAGTATTHG